MIVGFAFFAVATAHVHHHHNHHHKSVAADADSGAVMGGEATFEDQRQEEESHKPVTRRVGSKAEEVRRAEEEAAPVDAPPEQVHEEAPVEENDDGAEAGPAQESYMDENEADEESLEKSTKKTDVRRDRVVKRQQVRASQSSLLTSSGQFEQPSGKWASEADVKIFQLISSSPYFGAKFGREIPTPDHLNELNKGTGDKVIVEGDGDGTPFQIKIANFDKWKTGDLQAAKFSNPEDEGIKMAIHGRLGYPSAEPLPAEELEELRKQVELLRQLRQQRGPPNDWPKKGDSEIYGTIISALSAKGFERSLVANPKMLNMLIGRPRVVGIYNPDPNGDGVDAGVDSFDPPYGLIRENVMDNGSIKNALDTFLVLGSEKYRQFAEKVRGGKVLDPARWEIVEKEAKLNLKSFQKENIKYILAVAQELRDKKVDMMAREDKRLVLGTQSTEVEPIQWMDATTSQLLEDIITGESKLKTGASKPKLEGLKILDADGTELTFQTQTTWEKPPATGDGLRFRAASEVDERKLLLDDRTPGPLKAILVATGGGGNGGEVKKKDVDPLLQFYGYIWEKFKAYAEAYYNVHKADIEERVSVM